ncbi:MAG: cell division protein FtsH [Candidatus Colwellbacteria bacterium RIFCSPLOWO2_12_FULL_44_13]|uniref:ATP-dependent zinc metalloprotease FtsH n=1 Tax=Candidatus Colwellbacteria bacterium RIFCSPLOWO2_12_FULL_44_13 TaxID=1797694 RepID=A0A1G1Z9S3_9BACT|nr:MAG: cell division protein FtsH [Candidatus Colwellbacteria bacterium RIFCSPLOWO2_12_FULL_44_13]
MKNLSKNLLWAALVMFGLALFFASLAGTGEKSTEVTLSDVASRLQAGEVQEITVSGDELTVNLKNGEILKSQKESELGLTETLANYGVAPESLATISLKVKEPSGASFWLQVLLPTLLPLIIIGAMFWFIFRQAKSGANQAFGFGKMSVRLFNPFKDKATFKDVAGLKEAKQELEEVVDFLKNPKKFLSIGAKIPRGVLLIGPPGTGKTLLARAVAGEAGVPFFYISASEFVEMFVGVGASRTRDTFATAKRAAPAILFIDELDAIGRERGTGLGGGHDEREQTLNQILVEMDGFEKDTQVIVLAATNRPDVLDSALLRPGRFDRRVVLDLPDMKDREEILKIHARNKPFTEDVRLEKIAVRTPGFSGADLENLLNEAAILAAQKDKKEINQNDIYDSIEKVLLGPARKGRIISEKEKEIIAYHEAGHALVAASLKDADPVHKVSIVSRGQAGGYTLKLPLTEKQLHTKSHFIAELAVMLGGYAAEEKVFGEVTTGASSDLYQASQLSRQLVTRFGMSEKLGPVTFGKRHEVVFLGRDIGTEKDYSEKIASEIDEEVRSFIEHAHKTATKIVTSKKSLLKKIADALMQKETLEQEDFDELIKNSNLTPAAA